MTRICHRCGRDVLDAIYGESMTIPLDAEPTERGAFAVRSDNGALIAEHWSPARDGGEARYQQHTCQRRKGGGR